MNTAQNAQPSTEDVKNTALPMADESAKVADPQTKQVAKSETDVLSTENSILKELLKKSQEQVKEMTEKNKSMLAPNQVESEIFNPVVWSQMKGMAETYKASGALPADMNASKIVMVMQAGYEMGMKPIEAIKSFYFVKGTINIFGSAVARRLRSHGWTIQYVDEPNKCTATVKKDDEEYTDTLTFEEAEKSKWTSSSQGLKPGWYDGVNRKLKLRYGVLSILIKTYLPEVLGSATDIVEVAQDMAPVIEGAFTEGEADGEAADERTLDTLKVMGKYSDDDIKQMNLTQGQAIAKIKELQTKGGKK